MIDHLAQRIAAARSRARVSALGIYASQTGGTIRIQDAFRPASLVRVTDVIRQARTRTGAVEFPAHCVRAARRGRARIDGRGRQRCG